MFTVVTVCVLSVQQHWINPQYANDVCCSLYWHNMPLSSCLCIVQYKAIVYCKHYLAIMKYFTPSLLQYNICGYSGNAYSILGREHETFTHFTFPCASQNVYIIITCCWKISRPNIFTYDTARICD